MRFELTADQLLLRDTVRRFVSERVAPKAGEWDRAQRFPREIVHELAGMGLLGISVPATYDGAGLGPVEMAIVTEEVARGDGSLALTVASHNGLCASHINLFASHAQKERFLKPLARGEKLGAWALTEPGSGSDAVAMQTTGVRQGDTWLLNGSKNFITQGAVGEVFVVIAVTDKAAGHRGVTTFIVEKGTPGFTQAPIQDKLGMRSSDTAALSFSDVQVPDTQRLGDVGEGFTQVRKVLDRGRITIGALALGLGRGALNASLRYASERRQFGKPLADYQAIQWKLANMATELDAAELLVYRAAALAAAGASFSKEASMGKLFASEAAMRATEEAVQIHGGYGYVSDFPVERHFRDAKLCTIGEGTSEVQRMIIARHILRDPGVL